MNAFVQNPSIVSTVSQVLFNAFILESFSFVTSLTNYLLVFPKECDFPSEAQFFCTETLTNSELLIAIYDAHRNDDLFLLTRRIIK